MDTTNENIHRPHMIGSQIRSSNCAVMALPCAICSTLSTRLRALMRFAIFMAFSGTSTRIPG